MDVKKITLKQLAATLIGLILVIIGLVWFLQGAAILHLCPVLCFMNCECVVGGSPFWEAGGVIALLMGTGIIYLSLRQV